VRQICRVAPAAGAGRRDPGAARQDRVQDVVFAIHGGAGTIRRSDLTPEQEAAYRAGLRTALEAGRDVLRGGGDATEAVKAAIVKMEDTAASSRSTRAAPWRCRSTPRGCTAAT
jgi:hypothetical protein